MSAQNDISKTYFPDNDDCKHLKDFIFDKRLVVPYGVTHVLAGFTQIGHETEDGFEIEDYDFSYFRGLGINEVVLPDTVRWCDSYAFEGCAFLITCPDRSVLSLSEDSKIMVHETDTKGFYPESSLYRYFVSDNVMEQIERAVDRVDPNLHVVFAERASSSPDMKSIYHVIAYNGATETFTKWDSFDTRDPSSVLRGGTKNIHDFFTAKTLLNQDYYALSQERIGEKDYSECPDKDNLYAIDKIAEYYWYKDSEYRFEHFVAQDVIGYYRYLDAAIYNSNSPLTLLTEGANGVGVKVDLHDHMRFVTIGECLIDAVKFDNNAQLVDSIPLDLENLESFLPEPELKGAGYYIALSIMDLSESEDVTEITDIKDKMKVLELAKDIYNKPASYANKVDDIKNSNPDVANLCQRIKDCMDKYCGIDGTSTFSEKCELLETCEFLEFECNHYACTGNVWKDSNFFVDFDRED